MEICESTKPEIKVYFSREITDMRNKGKRINRTREQRLLRTLNIIFATLKGYKVV